ncbi:MAG: hypothetical protein NVS3B20_12550 [Polyangiales bacterium]
MDHGTVAKPALDSHLIVFDGWAVGHVWLSALLDGRGDIILTVMAAANLATARGRIGHVLKDCWVLENVVGLGGMAVVYAARHRNGGLGAIKLLHHQISEDTVVRERFLREAYLANSIDHPGVVRVLDDDADPELGPYLVMELLDGHSLLDLLERKSIFSESQVLDIADQTLDVLARAHELGIVHRDLKPANLFLCGDGTVKVLDFGIARILDDGQTHHLTRTGVPLGTPAYMAPEQARGQGRTADGRADVYELGATLFRLLAGRHVHVGHGAEQIAKVATQRAPKLRQTARVPERVALIVDRALEFEPDRRYQSARAMQSDVRNVRHGEAPAIASTPMDSPGALPMLTMTRPLRSAEDAVEQSTDLPLSDHDRDPVTLLAETARKRARDIARRPDAFRAYRDVTASTQGFAPDVSPSRNPKAQHPSLEPHIEGRAFNDPYEDTHTVIAIPLEMPVGPPPLDFDVTREVPPPFPRTPLAKSRSAAPNAVSAARLGNNRPSQVPRPVQGKGVQQENVGRPSARPPPQSSDGNASRFEPPSIPPPRKSPSLAPPIARSPSAPLQKPPLGVPASSLPTHVSPKIGAQLRPSGSER